jgi:hypothetical protein
MSVRWASPGTSSWRLEEVIEGGDGGLLHGLHGTGAVEEVGDFGEVWDSSGWAVLWVR